MTTKLDSSVFALDCAAEVEHIAGRLRAIVGQEVRRQGAVVALSGGVDSSVCVCLATKAFGPEKVCVLLLPERESSEVSVHG